MQGGAYDTRKINEVGGSTSNPPGNKAVWIKELALIMNRLHYKNTEVMSFEKSITHMQFMFIWFEDNNELLIEEQKIRILF